MFYVDEGVTAQFVATPTNQLPRHITGSFQCSKSAKVDGQSWGSFSGEVQCAESHSSRPSHIPETRLHLRRVSVAPCTLHRSSNTHPCRVNKDLHQLVNPSRRLMHGMLLDQCCHSVSMWPHLHGRFTSYRDRFQQPPCSRQQRSC